MGQAAKVSSVDALKEFKLALTEFGNFAGAALGEAQADVMRTISWIEHDMSAHWQQQLRRRTARLAEARSELFRAEVEAAGRPGGATLQRRAVEKAKRLHDQAEDRIQSIKRWRPLLEREFVIYKGHCQQLANTVEGDLPRALSKLEKMIGALEKYVKLPPPAAEAES